MWFRESTALIFCQDKHHTTILFFLPHWPRPMTFDPLFKVLLVIFQLGTGLHSIRLEKMILSCKFHILGMKTTLGQHIAKNLPVYYMWHVFLAMANTKMTNANQQILSCALCKIHGDQKVSVHRISICTYIIGKWYRISHFWSHRYLSGASFAIA